MIHFFDDANLLRHYKQQHQMRQAQEMLRQKEVYSLIKRG